MISRHEVSVAIKKLKMNHPIAMLTGEDNSYIADLFNDDGPTEEQVESEEVENLAESGNEDEEDSYFAYLSTVDLVYLKHPVSNTPFIHETVLIRATEVLRKDLRIMTTNKKTGG